MCNSDHDALVRPECLLSTAMGVGRELSILLRDQEGFFAHRDRVLVGTVMRASANRAVLEPAFRGPLEGLVDKIDRVLAAAAVSRTETVVVATDEDGDLIYAERIIRFIPDEIQPLVKARELATSLATLIDRTWDVVEAERATLLILGGRASR